MNEDLCFYYSITNVTYKIKVGVLSEDARIKVKELEINLLIK